MSEYIPIGTGQQQSLGRTPGGRGDGDRECIGARASINATSALKLAGAVADVRVIECLMSGFPRYPSQLEIG